MLILALALALDWYAGDPDFLWKRLPHPVALIGQVIDWADRMRFSEFVARLTRGNSNRDDLILGAVLLGLLLIISALSSYLIGLVSALFGPFWWLIEIPVVAVMLAQKSLSEHVRHVASALKTGGLEGGREAVSRIVGRDVSQLDESGVSKAAVESLAENFSDGVVAPAFWYGLFGLTGLIFYTAVNTADSMIGYRNEKYEFFGKPAALLDDVMNWPAARFSAFIVVVAIAMQEGFGKARHIWGVVMRDAPMHRSPNAGWPEAAYAAALGVTLGGARKYDDRRVNGTTLNASGRGQVTASDIVIALDLFRDCCFLLVGSCILMWLLW